MARSPGPALPSFLVFVLPSQSFLAAWRPQSASTQLGFSRRERLFSYLDVYAYSYLHSVLYGALE